MSKQTKQPAPPPPIAPPPPRRYIGPMPPPTISNLPCGCSHPANELARDEQDFLLATVPDAAAWFTEEDVI